MAAFGRFRVISVDYRMAPDHPYPAALDDVIALWRAVSTTTDPKKTALFGASAGGNLTLAAVPLGLFKLSYCLSVLAIGWFLLHLNPGQMQTLTFLMLVLAGQANIYVLRERDHFWRSHPAWVMLFASFADVAIITSLAASGVLMAPLMPAIIGMLFMMTIVFALTLDAIKIIVRARLRID